MPLPLVWLYRSDILAKRTQLGPPGSRHHCDAAIADAHSAKIHDQRSAAGLQCLIPRGGSKCLNLAKACRCLGRARSWPLEMCYFEPLIYLS